MKDLKKIKTVSITASNIQNFTPTINLDVQPKIWELPNRKAYMNWFYSNFNQYKIGNNLKKEKGNLQLFRIQRLVKNFFQSSNPNRGILLFHGLGLGKSCAAISISQAVTDKDIIFISKASLEPNFVYEIKKCGAQYMRTSNYWVFSKCETKEEIMLAKNLKIPNKVIKENGGCFFIDFTERKNTNYEDLNDKEKENLTKQIEATIYNKFTFLHLDDSRIIKKINEGDFDNKLVIIDEVHNLVNSMTSGTITGEFFYKFMMNSINTKYVFLSGTPLINTVFESSRLFNILRGYIPTLIYKIITNPNSDIDWSVIKSTISANEYADQIVIDKTRKTIKVTKNPIGFINTKKTGRETTKLKTKSIKKSSKTKQIWGGIKYSPDEDISFEDFRSEIDKILVKLGKEQKFNMKFNFENNTALPEDEGEFERLFYNPELNKLKNKEIIKKRIGGISSYYHKIVDKSEFPELKFVKIVSVPMSDYQLGKYKEVRNQEIVVENNKKRNVRKDQLKSSFRIYSRLHCSFAFPDEIGSPYDKENIEIMEKLEAYDENQIDHLDDISKPKGSYKSQKEFLKEYKRTAKDNAKIIKYFMNTMEKEKNTFLNKDAINTYSPKYAAIINNISMSPGSCFLYSQFINLVGLKMFALAIETIDNYKEFAIIKVGNKYRLNKDLFYDENPKLAELKQKRKKYIVYAGSEIDKETKEVLRLIYNSDYESMPPSCNYLIKELQTIYGEERNKYGNIIKLFMTTRTGAEGISLMNVRQVHIMEPYWQPVLIDQVIGRARRMGSHKLLKPSEQNVEVYIYMASFSPQQVKEMSITTIKKDISPFNDGLNKKGKLITSDEFLYIISERKKKIINEFNLLIMGSAFDCTLNYEDNIKKEKKIVCSDYNTNNRDEYLYTPNIEDTIDIVEIQQEFILKVNYVKFAFPRKGKVEYFYKIQNPLPGQRNYVYTQDILSKVGSKPVGEIVVKEGKKKLIFFKSSKSRSKKSSKRSSKKSSKNRSKK